MGIRGEDKRVSIRVEPLLLSHLESGLLNMFRIAPTLSLVLLSHSPLNYLSLYPYARAHWGLKCPVYATQPTVEMGRVVCLAESESWLSEHKLDLLEGELASNGMMIEETSGGEQQVTTTSSKGKQPLRGPFVPTLDEVHEAFDHIKAIRYNQPLHLSGQSIYLFPYYLLWAHNYQGIYRMCFSLHFLLDIPSVDLCSSYVHQPPGRYCTQWA